MIRFFVVACLALAACEPASQQTSQVAARSRGLSQPISGILVMDEQGGTLFPCPDQAAQRLADPSSLLRTDAANFAVGSTIWIQGQAAQGGGDTLWLEKLDQTSTSWWEAPCTMVKAIQGLGNEPGWELRIEPPKAILLRTQYGMVEAEFPFIFPAKQGSSWVYDVTVNAGENPDRLQISWEESPCQDNMAGNDFPYRVEVQWNDTLLTGCGRPLPPAKSGRE